MDRDHRISPFMRVLAGFLAACIVFFCIANLVHGGAAGSASIGSVINVLFVGALLALCLFFAITGRSP
jgi:hypothetical protein